MCGIYGMVSPAGRPLAHPEVLDQMAARLRHRGPDGHGEARHANAAFGTERLRVVDPSPAADQPFVDTCHELWLACNGEIYNAPELRARHARWPWRSRSDAETILPLFAHGGGAALAGLEGMFALAIWDARHHVLTLARDRAGEKPLFYVQINGEVWFASEIPALLRHPDMSRDPDPDALADYLALGYVRQPHTMFRAIRQVPAGTVVRFDAAGVRAEPLWSLDAVATSTDQRSAALQERELQTLLLDAVHRQVRADVPVGVFTSGGLDSSLLTTLAARELGPARVHAFSAAFLTRSYDESAAAGRAARAAGVRHTSVMVDEAALGEALDHLTNHMAEPLADPALLPTWLLARAARQDVTVALSGEGADELFGGYPTYRGHRLAAHWQALPSMARRAVTLGLGAFPTTHRRVAAPWLAQRFVATAHLPWRERHMAWFGSRLPSGVVASSRPAFPEAPADPADVAAAAMRLDLTTYLRDNLLVKLDRATMAVALEARAPYLDRALIEFAVALPSGRKLRGVAGKWLLRRAAAPWLPFRARARLKRGFSVPVSRWLNGGLRHETDRLLEPARLRREGVVDHLTVRRLLDEHRREQADHGRALWTLVMWQRWLERWGEGART